MRDAVSCSSRTLVGVAPLAVRNVMDTQCIVEYCRIHVAGHGQSIHKISSTQAKLRQWAVLILSDSVDALRSSSSSSSSSGHAPYHGDILKKLGWNYPIGRLLENFTIHAGTPEAM